MSAEPGQGFRWGAIKRRSAYNPDGTEQSTARQEDAIFSYVEQHGLGRIVSVYTDIASAFNEKARRPEFVNALEDLRAGRIDGIIVWKLDRLTRRRSQMRRILSLLEDCGGRLVSVVEGVDTADPAKKEITEIVLGVYVGAAQAESESISERIRLMHFDMARKGIPHHSHVRPFGHTDDWCSLVPAEVDVLHEAGRRVLAGEAANSIALDFTRRKIKTTLGRTKWHPEVLTRMLTSARMVGMREYGGKLYPLADVPPIFEREEWERICAKLERHARPQGPGEQRLLSNIALCECLSHVIAGGRQARGRRSHDLAEFSYRCRPRRKGREGGCGHLWITGALADAEVSRRVIAWLTKDNITNLLYRFADAARVDETQARINELTESLHALSKALAPPPGIPRMPLETYYERVREIEAERATFGRRLAVTREAAMLAELLEIEDVAAEWQARNVKWRRSILKLITQTIVIERRGKGEPGELPHLRRFDPSRVRIQWAI
jgi:DNA invertase Pin-like site-specific DNA recombinase